MQISTQLLAIPKGPAIHHAPGVDTPREEPTACLSGGHLRVFLHVLLFLTQQSPESYLHLVFLLMWV